MSKWYIYQSKETNALSHSPDTPDRVERQGSGHLRAYIPAPCGLRLIVEKYELVKDDLGSIMHKVFDFMVWKLTQALPRRKRYIDEPHKRALTITAAEYAKAANLANVTDANEQFHAAGFALLNLSFTWETYYRRGGYVGINVLDGFELAPERGKFSVVFTGSFCRILAGASRARLMYFPPELFAIDMKTHPLAYDIGRSLLEYNNMRRERAKVRSLIKRTPTLEARLHTSRNKTDEIRRPFEAALDELVRRGILVRWEYAGEYPKTFKEWLLSEVVFMVKSTAEQDFSGYL